jgi:hypothetical protein
MFRNKVDVKLSASTNFNVSFCLFNMSSCNVFASSFVFFFFNASCNFFLSRSDSLAMLFVLRCCRLRLECSLFKSPFDAAASVAPLMVEDRTGNGEEEEEEEGGEEEEAGEGLAGMSLMSIPAYTSRPLLPLARSRDAVLLDTCADIGSGGGDALKSCCGGSSGGSSGGSRGGSRGCSGCFWSASSSLCASTSLSASFCCRRNS